MATESRAAIDKHQVRRAFSRAADHYDEVAVLQREIGRRMLERLTLVRLQPNLILDLGAGTGAATVELARRYRRSRILALDFAFPMLLRARRRGVCAPILSTCHSAVAVSI